MAVRTTHGRISLGSRVPSEISVPLPHGLSPNNSMRRTNFGFAVGSDPGPGPVIGTKRLDQRCVIRMLVAPTPIVAPFLGLKEWPEAE